MIVIQGIIKAGWLAGAVSSLVGRQEAGFRRDYIFFVENILFVCAMFMFSLVVSYAMIVICLPKVHHLLVSYYPCGGIC